MYKEQRTIHINPAAIMCTAKPYWFIQPPNPPQYQAQLGTNTLEPLICGSQYLPLFKEAIEKAQHSIWIAIWGFDPSLSLVMGETTKNQKENYIGEVLKRVAKSGVEVKLLVFSDMVVNLGEPTLYGDTYGSTLENAFRVPFTYYGYSYNTRWVNKARWGDIKNLQLLTRSGPAAESPYRKTEASSELEALRKSERYLKAKRDHHYVWLSSQGDIYVPPSNIDWKNMREVRKLEQQLENSHKEYINEVNRKRAAQGLSPTDRTIMELTATDHQKMILIDHNDPTYALGFVQGFNFHSNYFDSPDHPYQNPARLDLDKTPIQDIGVKVRGAVLQDLFHNFKEAWNDAISTFDGSAATKITEAPPDRNQLANALGKARRVPAQILRTWKKTGEFTIEAMYKKNLGNLINEFIYVEDQYFRYPEFAQAILQRAKVLQEWGASKKIYVFVVTNPNTIESNKQEQASRADMLDLLNRSDTNVTAEQWAQQQDDEKALEKVRSVMENAGVMVQIGILRTSGTHSYMRRGKQTMLYPLPTYEWETVTEIRYEDIYIHSKLTIIDEAFYTLGSANWNLRSMRSDTELNIAAEDFENARRIREGLWGYHLNGIEPDNWENELNGKRTRPTEWFKQWEEVMKKNDKLYRGQSPRIANLFPLYEQLDRNSRFG